VEPLRNIDSLLGVVVKRYLKHESSEILCLNHGGKVRSAHCLLQRLLQRIDPNQGSAMLDISLVYHQFASPLPRPPPDQSPCRSRTHFATNNIAVEVKCCTLILILRVKVRRWMITKVHLNGNAEESRHLRHRQLLSTCKAV